MDEIVYLNGNFLPRKEAKISADDRGFIFADGVYEVVKYYQGEPFGFEAHLLRLQNSLKEIGIGFEGIGELKKVIAKLLKANNLLAQDAGVYIQITRGVAPRVHYFPDDVKPTIYIFSFPFKANIENLKNGINALTEKDIRWQRCDIKSVSLLPNIILYNKAHQNNAGETILVRDGVVTEATHSSVLGVKNGIVYTHPDSHHILPGITKMAVLEICRDEKIEVAEQGIPESQLMMLDELMITGTGSEITPVVRVNGVNLKDGVPGEITRKLQRVFFGKTYKKIPFKDRWWNEY